MNKCKQWRWGLDWQCFVSSSVEQKGWTRKMNSDFSPLGESWEKWPFLVMGLRFFFEAISILCEFCKPWRAVFHWWYLVLTIFRYDMTVMTGAKLNRTSSWNPKSVFTIWIYLAALYWRHNIYWSYLKALSVFKSCYRTVMFQGKALYTTCTFPNGRLAFRVKTTSPQILQKVIP